MPGRLTLCATPIGNLADASPRLAEALAAADVVYAEDTRRTRILLGHLGIEADARSYFVGNEPARAEEVQRRLAAGDEVVLVTDAGMPSVADPGLSAVRAAVAAGAEVSVVPGPSAVTAALAVSGMPADRFVFEGFLPRRAGERDRRLAALAAERRTIVLFSARSRVGSDLEAIARVLGSGREVVVARELTKIHEEVFRGPAAAAASRWPPGADARGEFTVVVAGAPEEPVPLEELLAEIGRSVDRGTRLSQAVREVADAAGVSRRVLYRAAITARDDA